jgi:glycosyltransferase involved in cell wall biosynthesis
LLTVSILINNHDYARFLPDCVNSALGQSYERIEVIVCDDASSDESLEVLKRFGDRLQVLHSSGEDLQPCFRQANAIVRAFERSSGDIVCLLDSDDVFLPDKVERVVEAFEELPEAVLVQHPFWEVEADGRRTGAKRPYLSGKDPRKEIYRIHGFAGVFTQTSGLSFRRSFLEEVLPLMPDEFDRLWADVRLSRLSIFYGGVETITEPLAEYRVHATNDSAKLEDKEFLAVVVDQMYRFFNQQAQLRGWDPIELGRSATRPDLVGVGRLIAQLQAEEGLLDRLGLLGRLGEKTWRRARRRMTSRRPSSRSEPDRSATR